VKLKVWLPAGLATAAVLAAGCASGVSTLSFPNPPASTAVTQPPPPSLPGQLSSISQTPVPGATTTTLPSIGPGSATLNGTVDGPNGPVVRAVVEVDRLVGDAVATDEVTTGTGGKWNLPRIKGGRYRVRAWQSPSLDMNAPQVVFLSGSQILTLPLQVTRYQGPNVAFAMTPGAPQQGQPANLVIGVTTPTVGSDGVLRNPPVVGAPVKLVEGPSWTVLNGNPRKTDQSGEVLFQVTCTTPGLDPLSAQVRSQPAVTLQLPSCGSGSGSTPVTPVVPIPTLPSVTTTTCPAAPTIGNPGSTTTSLAFGSPC